MDGLATIKMNKAASEGADLKASITSTERVINIEVQQFDSGKNWKTKTIPAWAKRHDLCTFIVFTEPTLERVRRKIASTAEYAFFKKPDVMLFAESQMAEIVALVGMLVMRDQPESAW